MWTSWDRNYRLHARLRGRDEQMIRYNVLLDSVHLLLERMRFEPQIFLSTQSGEYCECSFFFFFFFFFKNFIKKCIYTSGYRRYSSVFVAAEDRENCEG